MDGYDNFVFVCVMLNEKKIKKSCHMKHFLPKLE